jgi:ankyrin repeat protein
VTGACTSQGSDTDWLVETVELLVEAGADLGGKDDNDNTALILAVHWCGPRVATLLAKAGVERDARNGSGFSALALAFVHQKLEVAQALVDLGARLTTEERSMVESLATSPEAKALLRRASGPLERTP